MTYLANKQIYELVDTTLSWGRNIAEMWSGTQFEHRIDKQIEEVKQSAGEGDIEKTERLVLELAQFLEYAESEYDGH